MLELASALQGDEALLGQLVDGVGRALAGVAGVLDAAVGLLVGAEGRHLVDQDAAELEGAAGLEAAADVAGEDAGLEAELGVVGQRAAPRRSRRRCRSSPPGRRSPRTRPWPLCGGAVEQGRRQAAALVDQLAAGQQLGAAGDRLVDPLLDPVAVVGGDQRADVGVRVERVADRQLLDVGDEPLGEGVGDVLVDEDPLDRDAALAGVGEGVDLGLVGRRLPVAVVVDDQRRVGAELEVDLLVRDLGCGCPSRPGPSR